MNYKPSYTIDEDLKILNLIRDNEAYYLLRTKSWWMDLEKSNKFNRTWQSLKERFIKKIMPSICTYDIEEVEKVKIKLAWHQTDKNFSQSAPPEGVKIYGDDDEDDDDGNDSGNEPAPASSSIKGG